MMFRTGPSAIQTKDGVSIDTGRIATEIKARKEGRITGYGAVFGTIDQGHDLIEPGAFADSLTSGRVVKMLWQHNPNQPIGVWDKLSENDHGLMVEGRILKDLQAGREAIALLDAKAIDGLSIGYRTLEHRWAERDGMDIRIIEKAELWEVSLVTFPMNPEARIDAVKAAAMSEREFEREILRESGLSRSVVSALMRGGFNAVKALRESGRHQGEDLAEHYMAATLIETLKKGRTDA